MNFNSLAASLVHLYPAMHALELYYCKLRVFRLSKNKNPKYIAH